MDQTLNVSLRELLLTAISHAALASRTQFGPALQRGSVLESVASELRKQTRHLSPEVETALLTEWYDLFRTGLLAWGHNLSNPDPPFFHLTERGRQALAQINRDPSNPAGYLRHLDKRASLSDVSRSYLVEGLDCYVAGLFKAGAVMVGAAAESLILDLAVTTRAKLAGLNKPIPKDLGDWKVKAVADALQKIFEEHKTSLPKKTRETFEAYWPAFVQQIRATRNDAGHPTSVDPVTPDSLHASLLIFPELAHLVADLSQWATTQPS